MYAQAISLRRSCVRWIGGAALSFIDSQLITTQPGVFLCGLAAAVLLGLQRRDLHARAGLAIVLVCAGLVVYNDPTEGPADSFAPLSRSLAASSAGGLVMYFVLVLLVPNLSGLLAASQDWYANLQPWVDLPYAQTYLFDGMHTGAQWAHVAPP